jgi:hypothetical protein
MLFKIGNVLLPIILFHVSLVASPLIIPLTDLISIIIKALSVIKIESTSKILLLLYL